MYKKLSLTMIVFMAVFIPFTIIYIPKNSFTSPEPGKTDVIISTNTPSATASAQPEKFTLPHPIIRGHHYPKLHLPQHSLDLTSKTAHRLLGLINTVMHHLRENHYKLGGGYFNTSRGIYNIDCSAYVNHLLNTADPGAYWHLRLGSDCLRPTSEDYYSFFNKLPLEKVHHDWYHINRVSELKAGDILVFRYKHQGYHAAAGHVMVVMAQPAKLHHAADVYSVRVSDSAPSGHSHDTRPRHTSGIGIGTLLLKVNPKTGSPFAYAWKTGAPWRYDMYFAMARPI